ncbi:aminotransferase-like domain-containing protein [Nesterenkonia sp. DZ6]|uniref:aminotransferase-like domain-containing protein n=1 Tax=Nesterenkonia sp. DZ6 TaxID=2901229 RepID=UPI001F4C6AC8|nr:PLP-dependent aminotransferase family protein [Nesterenkonia sp. DZ6]MCH8559236.1 PLP-dependent aminotransferase family protein [Nesterenkonia sp. DZ6]
MEHHFAQRIGRVRPSAIRQLLQLGDDPSITSFGGGYPDPTLFPLDQLRSVYDHVLREQGRTALQYTATAGIPELRERIEDRMGRDGVDCSAEDVLVLQGAQQGLDLVAKLLINSGDVIITENPTFLGALVAFAPYEPDYAPVTMDKDGIDTDLLEWVLANTPRAKFIYVIPDFQNPTGVTLSLERRHRLLELANQHDIIVLEDTPYRELRFEGEQLPTLKSLDTEGRVIHLGSFSKTLAPGVRMGYAVASPTILTKLELLKLAADTQSSTLNMTATARFLTEFDLDAHLEAVRPVYRAKRDAMLSTMAETFPADVKYTRPQGGLFTWVTFPEDFDSARFMAEYSLPQARVAYVPGGTFFPMTQAAHYARFSYASVQQEEMVAGVRRLGHLLTGSGDARRSSLSSTLP